MLQIREVGSFAEANDLRIQEAPDIKVVKRDDDLKPGIKQITGKIRDIENGKEFYARFSMKLLFTEATEGMAGTVYKRYI